MTETLGHVLSISGAVMTASLDRDGAAAADALRIGKMVKVTTPPYEVIGSIASLHDQPGDPPRQVLIADLLGEIVADAPEGRRFRRGVSHYPVAGETVTGASAADLDVIYARPSAAHVRIGALYHDPDRPAYLMTDELLAKHFAVLGTTGSGKSCAVMLILQAILGGHPNAHIVVLDPHNEYAAAFGERAEIVTIDNLQLPFWLLNHAEAVEALVRGGTPEEQESQAAILKEAISHARRKFANDPAAHWITVDTPVPYRTGDLIRFIDEAMGRLDKPDTSAPYMRIKAQIESLENDRRFAFMFARAATRDILATVIGRILRIPVAGRPVSVVDLSGVPSEIVNVVVSLLCRIAFDFALWADRHDMPPVLLVAEEAHRYVPADERMGFSATTRAISRIAKEGRKYGVSLGLITQRPSELASDALAQCGTLFALRLGNELDQRFVGNALPEAAHGMLGSLPGLRPQEALVVGEGVPLPMRIHLDTLAPDLVPRSDSAAFSKAWQVDAAGTGFLDDGVRRWRTQNKKPGDRRS